MRQNEGMNDQAVPGATPTPLPVETPVVPVEPERQTWLDKIALWFDSIGISPKVGSMFVAGLLGIVASWIVTGDFGTDELRLLVANFILGAIGVTLPPASGYRQTPLSDHDANKRAAREARKAQGASSTRVR